MVRDFFEIIMECIASLSGRGLLGVVLFALVMGVLCWVACSYYTRLWHKRFHVRFQHHLLCAVAAILTVIFTVQFRAVSNLELIDQGLFPEKYNCLSIGQGCIDSCQTYPRKPAGTKPQNCAENTVDTGSAVFGSANDSVWIHRTLRV